MISTRVEIYSKRSTMLRQRWYIFLLTWSQSTLTVVSFHGYLCRKIHHYIAMIAINETMKRFKWSHLPVKQGHTNQVITLYYFCTCTETLYNHKSDQQWNACRYADITRTIYKNALFQVGNPVRIKPAQLPWVESSKFLKSWTLEI